MNAKALRMIVLAILFTVSPSMAAEITTTVDSVDVEDGDTLVVELDGKAERVQLSGIDAPEDTDNAKLQRDIERTGLDAETLLALGRAATSHLRSLVERDGPFKLTYDPAQRDRYGRITAEISGAGAGSLNVAMLEDGFAIVLPPAAGADSATDSAASARKGLQRDATAARRGLWGEEHRDVALKWRGSADD